MPELHETRMGQQLITVTLPSIAKSLEKIAACLEILADIELLRRAEGKEGNSNG